MILLILAACFIFWSWLHAHEYWNSDARMPWISIASLGLASVAMLLAFVTLIHWSFRGGYKSYDPTLLRYYAFGIILSLAGILLGLIGAAFKSSARWQALVAAFGMLLCWFACAATE